MKQLLSKGLAFNFYSGNQKHGQTYANKLVISNEIWHLQTSYGHHMHLTERQLLFVQLFCLIPEKKAYWLNLWVMKKMFASVHKFTEKKEKVSLYRTNIWATWQLQYMEMQTTGKYIYRSKYTSSWKTCIFYAWLQRQRYASTCTQIQKWRDRDITTCIYLWIYLSRLYTCICVWKLQSSSNLKLYAVRCMVRSHLLLCFGRGGWAWKDVFPCMFLMPHEQPTMTVNNVSKLLLEIFSKPQNKWITNQKITTTAKGHL